MGGVGVSHCELNLQPSEPPDPMRKTMTAYGRMCALFLLTAILHPLLATTIVMPTDQQLIEKTSVIVTGTVLASVAVDRDGGIWTDTTVQIERVLRGAVEGTIVISEVGGRVGDRVSVVYGNPEYKAGERVLLFLSSAPDGRYRTRDLFVGKFTERFTQSGERLWHRDDSISRTNLLDARFQPLSASSLQRQANRFEQFLENQLLHGSSSISYFVEPGNRLISENFTLISEPTLYRWFAFDNGGAAPWRSFSTQTGYSDGGVAELRTAMTAWSGYSEAKINYSYAGAGSGAPGGLTTPNGVNEVIFGDATNEIEGSWTGSSGVVGRGGFNNVRAGGSWSAPFTADVSHPQQTYASTGNIMEGNLVIQDGVSPGRGISSAALAEILSHEFGHTLGFGHSSDGSALMFASVTGIGASLRADDRTGARWLYPNGSVGTNPPPTPPPPTPATVPLAPSNVAATLVDRDVRLTWSDNSNSETQQHIYISTGGAFTREGTIGANITSVRVSELRGGVTYAFRITAANTVGESGFSNTASIATPADTLQASFTVSATNGTAGITAFAFRDQSTGSVTTRAWTFGDGGTSSEPNPSYIYTRSGSFTAMLVVSNGSSQSSYSRSITVTSTPTPLVASFDYSPAAPTTSDSMNFVDRTSGAISWSWNFGDGTTSTAQNPTKRYDSPGSRTVTLTAGDGTRTASISRTFSVTAGSAAVPPVNAEFDFPTGTARVGDSVSFFDRSSGNPSSWTWNFGDGTISRLQNPAKIYTAAGTFAVTLVVANAGGSSSRSRAIVVERLSSEFRSLIPVTAQTSGAGGTEWKTELTIFNAGDFAVNVDLVYVPSSGGTSQTRATVLPGGASQTYTNALRDLFGISSGAGAIEIAATSFLSTPQLKISSRTYTGENASGTYGQFVPDMPSIASEVYLTALESTPQYRTNIGLVNRSSLQITASLTLHDSLGMIIGTANIGLPASTFNQTPINSLFPQIGTRSLAGMSMRITADRPESLAVYASTIDNRTQDPVYQPAIPTNTGGELVIPAVGRTQGAGSTFWRSDVTFYNPSAVTLNLSISYLPQGSDNRNAAVRTAVIYAGTSATIRDVLTWAGAGNGSGALRIQWAGNIAGPVVTSRTYTPRASDNGTYGQSIDPVDSRSFSARKVVTGLRSDSQFRSNAGFVNGSAESISARVALVSPSGQELASGFIALAPRSQTQLSLASLFPSISVDSLGNVTLRAETTSDALFAYGSVIDNFSGDPIFIGGR